MTTIALPSGTVYVKYSVITHLFARAMCSPAPHGDPRSAYAMAYGAVDRKLARAVELGDLRARDPLTFAPHSYPVGDALREAVILVNDLREYSARHGLPEIEPDAGSHCRGNWDGPPQRFRVGGGGRPGLTRLFLFHRSPETAGAKSLTVSFPKARRFLSLDDAGGRIGLGNGIAGGAAKAVKEVRITTR